MSSTQQLLLGEGAGGSAPVYIEEVFSTYLYTGNSPSTNTIVNGIDLSTKGGLVWCKQRDSAGSNSAWDTARGVKNLLIPNQTAANLNIPVTYPSFSDYGLQSFNSNGFTLGKNWEGENAGSASMVSWTFRKQPKFFDIVTFTTNGSPNPNTGNISHNLGSTPGCVMVKSTSASQDWKVYHIGTEGGGLFAINRFLQLNDTGTPQASTNWINVSSTTISFPGGALDSGVDYVAYLFAHNAGGFGLAGTDNVISCGSFTSDGSGGCSVTLGYEPQWVIYKNITSTEVWRSADVMRGWSQTQLRILNANSTAAEGNVDNNPSYLSPTATGFQSLTPGYFTPSEKFVYIACRRGPMKVPTLGTTVFEPQLYTGSGGTDQTVTGPTDAFQYDSVIQKGRSVDLSSYSGYGTWISKLQKMSTVAGGDSRFMGPAITNAETSGSITNYTNIGFTVGGGSSLNFSGTPYVNYWLRRAPSFFDVVCYTGGIGTPRVLDHNLATPPELVITKKRNAAGEDWVVNYNNGSSIIGGYLNNTTAFANSATAPSTDITSLTSTTYTLNTSNGRVNGAFNYVAYLFATCAGVSKVGSYSGNTGVTVVVPCGFTAGVRFVLIKRTDSTGDWYVWDSARGIIPGNDPYLLLNSTAAEVTGTDYVDTYAAGFEVTSTAPADLNATGGTYIFLAIA